MIAHIDADAFFASVLERSNPQIRGKPIIAIGMGGGCVIAASYAAKAYGVKTAMRVSDARKLLPKGYIAQAVDFADAHTASRQIESILRSYCPTVEDMSVDEWYLDLRSLVGGTPKDLSAWAQMIQHDVTSRTGIPVSVGIGATKLLAKMASPYRKPKGIVVVHEGPTHEARHFYNRCDFLASLPSPEIPGIGWRRSVHVEALQLKTALDIAMASTETLSHLFGKTGREMQMELNGISVNAVENAHALPKSVSRCRSFPKTKDVNFVTSQLLTHFTYMIYKMRRYGLGTEFLGMWLRDGAYHHHHKDVRLPQLMTTEDELLPYMRDLTKRLFFDVDVCTQAGLVLGGLRSTSTVQYSLFENVKETDRTESLQKMLDTLRTKFGRDAVRRGGAILTPKLERELFMQEGS